MEIRSRIVSDVVEQKEEEISEEYNCCAEMMQRALSLLGSAWSGMQQFLPKTIKFYKQQALVHRTYDERHKNLNELRKLFPDLQANDLVLSCDLATAKEFHALYSTLFTGISYREFKEVSTVLADKLCVAMGNEGTISDFEYLMSIHLLKETLVLIAPNLINDADLLENYAQAVFRLFQEDEDAEKTIEYSSVESFLALNSPFVKRMRENGFSERSIEVTLYDLFSTTLDPMLEFAKSAFTNIGSRLDMQKRLQLELACGNRTYLDQMLIESLRLRPPIEAFGSLKCKIGDLAQNSRVTGYGQYNVNKFDPDRINSIPPHPKLIPFLPFGYGPNGCPFSLYVMDVVRTTMIAIFKTKLITCDRAKDSYFTEPK
ncbi:MAG: hypothetical protein Q8K75_08390 [Chlamydiales bacterium]|nr:hypothetical protein [Chlamydiales bacterium]